MEGISKVSNPVVLKEATSWLTSSEFEVPDFTGQTNVLRNKFAGVRSSVSAKPGPL